MLSPPQAVESASPVFAKVLKQTYDLEYLFRKVKEEGV